MNTYTFDFKITKKGKYQGFRGSVVKASNMKEAIEKAKQDVREQAVNDFGEDCKVRLNSKWKH